MVVVTSWKFTHNAWLVMEGSPDPGGIPFRFLIKGAITAGFVLLFFQALSMGIHSLFRILGIEKPEAEEHTS
jgi:TRAP-type mannitol/chloroaromatic compound transport system permease small subunit